MYLLLKVPLWERGEEKATMLEPRQKNINILGLGRSVSTPPEGITGEVVVVESFDALDEIDDDFIEGKIVLFIPKFTTYGQTVTYRSNGASKAAAKGAAASLVRSVTPFSIDSPHTGSQTYSDDAPKIPTAAIAIEDADLITRIVKRGEKVVLNINLSSTYYEETKESRNTIVELKGHESPEKLVIVSGHIDSWDVGQGAMDDGGGIFVSWAAPVIMKRLNIIPRRTVQAIFWTAEELGLTGVKAYKKHHMGELENINFVLESDEGTFAPRGLEVVGSEKTQCILGEVLKLFKNINASSLHESTSAGSDIQELIEEGVPGAGLMTEDDRYFWFHHTEGDTMNVESPEELDMGTAFWTTVAYIIADLSLDMPR